MNICGLVLNVVTQCCALKCLTLLGGNTINLCSTMTDREEV